MAQSVLTILFDDTYNLNIQDYSESNDSILSEKAVVLDPTFPVEPNTVLSANGRTRQQITISGYCSIAEKVSFANAVKDNTKVYPSIYPDGGSTNVIDANTYYYITGFSGNFIMANSSFWYSMTLIWGGVDV